MLTLHTACAEKYLEDYHIFFTQTHKKHKFKSLYWFLNIHLISAE